MGNQTGNLIELISEEKLSKRVEKLKFHVRMEATPSFISGYCASCRKTFDDVADYISESLYVSPEHRHCLSLLEGNVTEGIKRIHADEKGELAVVKITGFLGGDVGLMIPHRYSQNMTNLALKIKTENPKKIIVITYLDSADKNYDWAVGQACHSRFAAFLYEFKP